MSHSGRQFYIQLDWKEHIMPELKWCNDIKSTRDHSCKGTFRGNLKVCRDIFCPGSA